MKVKLKQISQSKRWAVLLAILALLGLPITVLMAVMFIPSAAQSVGIFSQLLSIIVFAWPVVVFFVAISSFFQISQKKYQSAFYIGLVSLLPLALIVIFFTLSAVWGGLAMVIAIPAKAELNKIETSLERFRADTGKYPNSLDNLEPVYLDKLPGIGTIAYVGSCNEFTLKYFTAETSKRHQINLGEIQSSLDRYFDEKGLYPSNLDTLVPSYLCEMPRLLGGEEQFEYSPSIQKYYTPENVYNFYSLRDYHVKNSTVWSYEFK